MALYDRGGIFTERTGRPRRFRQHALRESLQRRFRIEVIALAALFQDACDSLKLAGMAEREGFEPSKGF